MGVAGAKVRLVDIAEQAGVSSATVSRVLNGKPGVSPTARQQVLAALDVLGYARPERGSEGSSGLVGVIVPDLLNPIFPAFAQEMQLQFAALGYTQFLCSQAPGGVTETEYLDTLVEHRVDGIVIVSGLNADTTATHDDYGRLRGLGVPMAFVNGYLEGVDATFVSHDDAASMELAVRHLVSLGHARIGLATGPARLTPSARKIEGFARAMATHVPEAPGEPPVELSLYTVEGGQAAAARLLDAGCTAVVCGSDLMAIGAIRAARAAGMSVPDDASVVGFDDAPFNAYLEPGLTTIRQSVVDMSRAVVSALVSEIDGEPTARGEMLFQPELVARGSTGPVRDQT